MNEPLTKPPYGTPCNGCGLCCQNELCPLGEIVFVGAVAPCPALEKADDGRFVCGLVANPQKYAPIRTAVYGVEAMREAAAISNGVGIGCDARLEGEPDGPPEYKRALVKAERTARAVTRRTLKLWGPR